MILVIGYGSLMSRFGIDRKQPTRDIDVFNPFIVRFKGFRGFNTIKDHYMDIGKNFNPVGEQVDNNGAIDESGNSFECLAYYIKDEDLYIPEPIMFLENNSDEINDLYKKVSQIEVPSLVEQLRITHNIRQEIDRFFIEKLELNIWKNYGTINKFLKIIQKELLKELIGLCPSDF